MNKKTIVALVASTIVIAACGKSGPPAPKGQYQSKFGPEQTFTLMFVDEGTVEASFDEGSGAPKPRRNAHGHNDCARGWRHEGRDRRLHHARHTRLDAVRRRPVRD